MRWLWSCDALYWTGAWGMLTGAPLRSCACFCEGEPAEGGVEEVGEGVVYVAYCAMSSAFHSSSSDQAAAA
jgi:hypothetical protein